MKKGKLTLQINFSKRPFTNIIPKYYFSSFFFVLFVPLEFWLILVIELEKKIVVLN